MDGRGKKRIDADLGDLPCSQTARLVLDVSELAEFLDHCRTKRHEVTYETVGVVSREEAEELFGAVRELERHVRDWLAREHAEFL